MRIHVTFKDRVGITQEILMLLGARNLNLDAVEMSPPNVYIDAPTLSQKVLDELHQAFVPGRVPDTLDWWHDTIGAGIGAGLWGLYRTWRP